MRNLDIRVMVSESGLKYTDIARQMNRIDERYGASKLSLQSKGI